MPEWVAEELGLREGSTYSDLGQGCLSRGSVSEPVKRFLTALLQTKKIFGIRCFEGTWPAGLHVADIPWRKRTRHCLESSGLIVSREKMMKVTFGELLGIWEMGLLSVLDFCCTLEASITVFVDGKGDAAVDFVAGKPLEEALMQWLGVSSGFRGERLVAMGERLGFLGLPAASLEKCGARAGVSKERFRQIQDDFIGRMGQRWIAMPELDRALQLLERHAPMGAVASMALLKSEGICSVDFHPSAMMSVVLFFNRAADLAITWIDGREFVSRRSEMMFAGRAVAIARNLARKSGVASTFAVEEELRREIGAAVLSGRAIMSLLREFEDFHFVDGDWFFVSDIAPGRNRLVNVTNRMLSVSNPLGLETLFGGIERHYKWRGLSYSGRGSLVVPPLAVLEAFYRDSGVFVFRDGMVSPQQPVDYRDALGKIERTLLEAFKQSPTGVLDRLSLWKYCSSRGVGESSFGIYLWQSPIVEHVGVDMWKLRGTPVKEGSLEVTRQARHAGGKEKRVLGCGWNRKGLMWMAFRVLQNSGSLIILCPSAIRQHLAGRRFCCFARDTMEACGRISVNTAGASYGYSRFVALRRLGEGDVLVVEFNMQKGVALLSVGDQDFCYFSDFLL